MCVKKERERERHILFSILERSVSIADKLMGDMVYDKMHNVHNSIKIIILTITKRQADEEKQ